MSTSVKTFGEYLKKIRLQKKLTLRQLDKLSGISSAYLSQLETGKRSIPSPDTLRKLSEPLDVPYKELMKRAGHLRPTIEEVEQAIKEKDIEEVLEEYREVLTYKGQKISDEEIKKMLQVLKWIYEAKGES